MKELSYPHGAIEIQEHLIDLFDKWKYKESILLVKEFLVLYNITVKH